MAVTTRDVYYVDRIGDYPSEDDARAAAVRQGGGVVTVRRLPVEHFCLGCDELRTDMEWMPDGRFLCDWCREVVCIHGISYRSYCRPCWESGEERICRTHADWSVDHAER